MGDRLLTFDNLRQRGWPYTRQHTTRLEKAGRFPPRVQVGPNRVAWWESQYEAHVDQQPRGPLDISHRLKR